MLRRFIAPSLATTRATTAWFPRVRVLVTRPPRSGRWNAIPPKEQDAWAALGWNADSWEGKKSAPLSSLQSWDELSQLGQSAASHGLEYTPEEWNAHVDDLAGNSLLATTGGSGASSTAPPLTNVGGGSSSLLSPQSKRLAAAVATSVIQTLKSAGALFGDLSKADSDAPPVVIDGLETTLYIDDSASMEENGPVGRLGRHSPRRRSADEPCYLDEGKKVLRSMAPLIAGPTRVIKFGTDPTPLHLRDAFVGHTETALVPAGRSSSTEVGQPATGPPQWVTDSMGGSGLDSILSRWDASSLGTYMWHMIEQDVLHRYRPGRGTLRLIVITDGEDMRSPPAYQGIQGMDPMQRTLQAAGYDIEWHIVVLGAVRGSSRYAALAGATGGSYVQFERFDEDSPDVRRLLAAIAGGADASGRRSRQQQYQLEATRGEAEEVPWFKALPPPDGR